MRKEKVDTFQLLALIILFELGTAMIVGVGLQARQAAWLTVIISMVGGALLYLLYHYLYNQFPTLSFIEYLPEILGKYMGWTLGLVYVIYFIYLSARVLRDFGDLLTNAYYNYTPVFVVNCIFIFTVFYLLSKGIEVLARVGEIMFGIYMLLFLIVKILMFSSGIVKFDLLFPILPNGWTPVLKSVFPSGVTFPFGELIAFLMILPFYNQQKKAKKIGLLAILISGILLSFSIGLDTAVIGPDSMQRSTFPTLEAISKIQIGFLQHLDVFFLFKLIIANFFKLAIFYYAATFGAAKLYKLPNDKSLLFPIGIIILFSSLIIAGNFAEHIKIGLDFVPLYIHLPIQIGIPFLLVTIVFIRKKIN
ncbi:GerAB/ArcD/ProY family transporter [Fictibacillus sp. FJAT-27399]|uniref:GerAB/ArcD/ProY family transporter n=1 Tax=Fictibacillus sp. FJAT-27399 TaxID=1729689 RepID=UPI000785232A|nr:GerAB/ArcD/ProY family transporter [Fictibacillus sp. FJAT-27399]